jgi:hypothetical protein
MGILNLIIFALEVGILYYFGSKARDYLFRQVLRAKLKISYAVQLFLAPGVVMHEISHVVANFFMLGWPVETDPETGKRHWAVRLTPRVIVEDDKQSFQMGYVIPHFFFVKKLERPRVAFVMFAPFFGVPIYLVLLAWIMVPGWHPGMSLLGAPLHALTSINGPKAVLEAIVFAWFLVSGSIALMPSLIEIEGFLPRFMRSKQNAKPAKEAELDLPPIQQSKIRQRLSKTTGGLARIFVLLLVASFVFSGVGYFVAIFVPLLIIPTVAVGLTWLAVRGRQAKIDEEVQERVDSYLTYDQHEPINPYHVLGVAEDASYEDVKTAYHEAAKQAHPDRGTSGDEDTYKQIQAAYELIFRLRNERKSWDDYLFSVMAKKREAAELRAKHVDYVVIAMDMEQAEARKKEITDTVVFAQEAASWFRKPALFLCISAGVLGPMILFPYLAFNSAFGTSHAAPSGFAAALQHYHESHKTTPGEVTKTESSIGAESETKCYKASEELLQSMTDYTNLNSESYSEVTGVRYEINGHHIAKALRPTGMTFGEFNGEKKAIKGINAAIRKYVQAHVPAGAAASSSESTFTVRVIIEGPNGELINGSMTYRNC